MVKFEGLLMQQVSEEELNRKGKSLEDEEVEELRHELDAQIQVRTALQAALKAPVSSRPKLSSLPPMVQQLIEEVMYIEEEIFWLERKVKNLKLSLLREKALTKCQEKRYHRRMLIPRPTDSYPPQSREGSVKCKTRRNGRASICSPVDLRSTCSTMSNNGDVGESSRSSRNRRSHTQPDLKNSSEKPNKLSEELIRCLVNILLKLNKASLESRGSAVFQKHQQPLSNKKSKRFMSRTSLSCTTLCTFSFNDYASNLDPYGILQDSDGSITQIGSYKNFIEVSRSSLDTKHISECLPEMGKLRILLQKLKHADLSYLTNKQKLAFWINIYNACIMHVFLQHGLPLSGEDQVALMNKAAINVGGIILNALAIEHFILRHPSDSEYDLRDEKGIMLRTAYGLGYPEPNITFALCRGSWSSPALRIYTHDVVNELERAKVEYLEASVGVSSSKKKIMVPKLMRWHMRDFADDMESLIEWIYSQLPHSCTLKGLIMECLEGGKKTPLAKMIEIQPYASEFRYLLLL
ncbi:unnamed protein product [Cuscuta epithymum]|uniref:DUF547 domain-containing protein n=1 Tax=Cuscuta epithymum TaxID=186058 RepID=A0AAV0EBU5_9ASTE|nr:unnamed protein product [Cuscuta epithymum]